MTRIIVLTVGMLLTSHTLWGQLPSAPFRYQFRTSMVAESNIEHEDVPVAAVGGVVGMGFFFQDQAVRPWIELRYEAAGHRYSIRNRWNRVSHDAQLALSARPTRRLAFRTEGNVTLKGSSEDRDLGDQYTLSEELEWRPPSGTRLRLRGTTRLRRFGGDGSRDAVNRYLDVEVRQQLIRSVRWSVGGRVERNDSESDRHDYDRWTLRSEMEFRGPFGEVSVEGKYRPKHYRSRVVDELPDNPFRRDQQRQLQVEWTLYPWRALGITMTYEFENRRSNDPDKPYVAHQFGLSFIRSW